jgi:membrane protease YdiL (CAAX protease family)
VNLDPRPTVPPRRLAWITLAACLAATIFGFVVERFSPAVGLWFSETFCLLGVAWALTRWSGRAPAAYVGLRWPGLPAVVFASALAVANFFGLAAPINAISQHFAPAAWRDTFDVAHLVDQFSSVDLWVFATAAVVAAAFCEEFLFRGVLQHGLSEGGAHPAEAIVRTALVFALFHLNPVSVLALLELGLFFGLLYHRTGSLIPSMVAHATQNATALGLYFLARQSELAEASGEPSATQIVGMAGMGLVALAMLVQVGRHFPAVWGRRATANAERPRVSLGQAFAPWLVGASVFLFGWYLVDRRGMELGVVDLHVELPAPRPNEPPEVHSARTELEALRQRVRAGKAPLQSYLDSRRALAESLGDTVPKLQRAK